MRVAGHASDFGPVHSVRAIFMIIDDPFVDRLRKARPAAIGFEFILRTEKRFAGRDVDVDPVPVLVPKRARERPFRPVFPDNLPALRAERRFELCVVGLRIRRRALDRSRDRSFGFERFFGEA